MGKDLRQKKCLETKLFSFDSHVLVLDNVADIAEKNLRLRIFSLMSIELRVNLIFEEIQVPSFECC